MNPESHDLAPVLHRRLQEVPVEGVPDRLGHVTEIELLRLEGKVAGDGKEREDGCVEARRSVRHPLGEGQSPQPSERPAHPEAHALSARSRVRSPLKLWLSHHPLDRAHA